MEQFSGNGWCYMSKLRRQSVVIYAHHIKVDNKEGAELLLLSEEIKQIVQLQESDVVFQVRSTA